jgi:hypothetical protein
MKTLLLALCLLCGTITNAQQSPCDIDNSFTEPGIYPSPDSIDCFIGGGYFNDITIQFVNFDSTTVSGIRVRVDYIIIDSILNLPCGIKWTTSAQRAAVWHRFENQEKGCIRFWGYTNDAAGQYKLKIKVKAKVNLLPNEVPYEAEALGYRVDVRMKANICVDSCPAIDTTANAVLLTASCTSVDKDTVFYWKMEQEHGPCDGVNEIGSFSNFTFYPNPTANSATVSFTADKAAAYTTRIVNIYGQEVSREVLNVTAGLNVNKVDVSNLATGVYIFTITDGKNVQTQRFVVEK